MRHTAFLWASLCSLGFIAPAVAQEPSFIDGASETTTELATDTSAPSKHPRLDALKELKHVTRQDLKVDANAAQPDEIKDPLQPLNRQIYAFNDMLDRNVARPLAVQYVAKVPTDVRGSYRHFRKNMGEPWNAVNQLAQGRPLRAIKSLGRFTINTITTLGLADPARRLGLETEEEDLGTTLGYYGVPSGAYIMLPIMGPSTLRDAAGRVIDSQARPQKYLLEEHDNLYWTEQVMRGVDTRANLLDVESVLQGDKYAAIRDIYLQRKKFEINEKKGGNSAEDVSFIEDESETNSDN